MSITIDLQAATVTLSGEDGDTSLPLQSKEAFAVISDAWLRCGWDTKYVYSFAWMGRPIIQLPEDMMRVQEAIYAIKPTVIVETGVAHGGSLIFYASLFKAMGLDAKVIGVDIEIRPHNRTAIETHELSPYITLVEGSSVDPDVVAAVKRHIDNDDRVFVMLDSNHSKDHVFKELEAYAPLVARGSYIVAADGIMGKVKGAPRTEEDREWNNPTQAAHDFVAANPDFVIDPPAFPFNEGMIEDQVTYWPDGWIKRIR